MVLDLGIQFKDFSWILAGVELSNAQIFTPDQAGRYSLIAKDWQGCAFFADFEVEEKCEPELRYPNAIRTGDPERSFEIYPDNLVDELELFIYNRWGQLIYHCEDKKLEDGVKSSCVWDGTFNSTAVPNSSYSVLLRIRVKGQNLTVVQKTSVTVF